jgi:hypothetical protein
MCIKGKTPATLLAGVPFGRLGEVVTLERRDPSRYPFTGKAKKFPLSATGSALSFIREHSHDR